MFTVVHGQFFSLELFVQVFFKLIDLMGRGADWSLADVQFVRDGMAGGANLSLLARSLDWSYSSLEKLVRRIKHGESGTRKQRASRVHADVVDRREEDSQANPRQSWADLAVKYECSRYTIRRKLSFRTGKHTSDQTHPCVSPSVVTHTTHTQTHIHRDTDRHTQTDTHRQTHTQQSTASPHHMQGSCLMGSLA